MIEQNVINLSNCDSAPGPPCGLRHHSAADVYVLKQALPPFLVLNSEIRFGVPIASSPSMGPAMDAKLLCSQEHMARHNLSLDGTGSLRANGRPVERDLRAVLFKPTKAKMMKGLSLMPTAAGHKKTGTKAEIEARFWEAVGRMDPDSPLLDVIAVVMREGVRPNLKDWYKTHLALYGVSFKDSSTLETLRTRLEKACLAGVTDRNAGNIAKIVDALKQKEADEARKAEEERVARNDSHWVHRWKEPGGYSQMVYCDASRYTPGKLMAELSGVLATTPDPFVLRNVAAKHVPGVIQEAGQFGLTCAQCRSEDENFVHVIVALAGRDGDVDAVKNDVERQTKKVRAERKRKRDEEEQEERELEERRLQQQRERQRRFENELAAIRQDVLASGRWNPRGTWRVTCPEADNYSGARDDGYASYYDVGSTKRFRDDDDGSASMPYEFEISGSDNLWVEFDLGFLEGHMKLTPKSRGKREKDRTYTIRWGARETGTGEMIFGKDHIGEMTFADGGASVHGWMNGAYGKLEFTGALWEPNPGDKRDLDDDFSQYNHRNYEAENRARWH